MAAFLTTFQTATELGLITSIAVLALFISYINLNICDLSTDGSFTLGASVGAVVALAGYPYLAILAAIGAGMISGLVVAFLQTKLHINSLLAGIVVNTGLYSINIAVMGNSSILNLNKTRTIFSDFKTLLAPTFLSGQYKLVLMVLVLALVVVFISLLLKTKFGLALRATGDNLEMVKSSSINPTIITIIGLMISNGLTALSGSLMAFSVKSADINMGSGIVTVALASLLIGTLFFRKRGITLKVIGAIIGAILFRFVYTLALKLDMPASYLKLVSAIIVVIALSARYIKDPVLRGVDGIRKLLGGRKNA
ncbi:MAG: ABC transporter permease [Bacilli bacterium]|nr:ABC transporter permease [Bacilli bacterium]